MKLKHFARSDQTQRQPRSHDFYPGVAQVPLDSDNWKDPEQYGGTYYSPQSDQWSNTVPSALPRGLSEEQLYQFMKRVYNIDKEKFKELYKQVRGSSVAPKMRALDQQIKALVEVVDDSGGADS